MNAHEPIRQEDAHAQAKKKQKVTVFTAHVIVADAREPGEPQLFYFSLQDAPRHMQKQLKQNNNTTYEFLSNDGAESLMELSSRIALGYHLELCVERILARGATSL